MAFPIVAATATSYTTADPATVNLPGGINAGDLLLIISLNDGGALVTSITGFTEFVEQASGTACAGRIHAKVAAGSEGATISADLSTAQDFCWIAYRITGWHGALVDGFDVAGANSAAGTGDPNPPSLSPGWGAADTLWVAGGGSDNGLRTYTADTPTNYVGFTTNPDLIAGGGSGGSTCVGAFRQLNAATEDPGIFDINTADEWVAFTVAVRPSSAVASRPLSPRRINPRRLIPPANMPR